MHSVILQVLTNVSEKPSSTVNLEAVGFCEILDNTSNILRLTNPQDQHLNKKFPSVEEAEVQYCYDDMFMESLFNPVSTTCPIYPSKTPTDLMV
jgi:hypothetical protein